MTKPEPIGARIKAAREKCGMSIDSAATALCISKKEYEAYENGEKSPAVTMHAAIARALQTDTETLLGIGAPPEPQTPHPEAYAVMRGQGKRIRQAREACGMTAEDAAVMLSLTPQEYVDLEAGTENMYARIGLIPKVAALYHVTELYLILGEKGSE